MLCMFCEGTENSPLPHSVMLHSGGPLTPPVPLAEMLENCPDCGESLWSHCPECIGLGRKLKIVGTCSRCGRSVPYWQECNTCHGAGRVPLTHPTCRVPARRRPAVHSNQPRAAGQRPVA